MTKPKPEAPREEPPDQRKPYELPPAPSAPDPPEPPSPQQDPPVEEPERKTCDFYTPDSGHERNSGSSIEQSSRCVVAQNDGRVDMARPGQQPAPKVLQDLLDICLESQAGLLRAASRAQKVGLKEFFGAEALQQALFAAELELELNRMDSRAKQPRRRHPKLPGWKEMTGSRLLPSGDQTVLFLCEWGERAALAEYLKALQSGLPAHSQQLVERQHSQWVEAYQRLDEVRGQLQGDRRGQEQN